jgi:hypothetical protein
MKNILLSVQGNIRTERRTHQITGSQTKVSIASSVPPDESL